MIPRTDCQADLLAFGQDPIGAATQALRAAVPRQWRSVAARAYTERLAELTAGCVRAAEAVAVAEGALARHRAELAAARAALDPFGLAR